MAGGPETTITMEVWTNRSTQLKAKKIKSLTGSLEAKIETAERLALEFGEVSGTIIQRVLRESGTEDPRWCVALGKMGMPKVFGYGLTIEAALTDAVLTLQEKKKLEAADAVR